MRTTLTIEPEIARKLKARMAARKLTLKDAVNQARRAGLAAERRRRGPAFAWSLTHSRSTGVDRDKLNQLADGPEAEEFSRKLRR